MSKDSSRKHLTAEQSDVLEKAAFVMIKARQEAAAMLSRAGISVPEDGFGFGSPCHAHIEGFGDCPCSDYEGDGGPCLRRITVDPASAPLRSCGHPPSKHFST
jgi:hypothetical protein